MFIVQLHMTHEALFLFTPDTDYNMFTNIYKIPFHHSTSFIQSFAFVDGFWQAADRKSTITTQVGI